MATRFGLTWWGRRWIGSLETLGAAYANRLPRGRTYARRGAVRRLEVTPGEVTAHVDGSRAVPYRVTLRLPAFSDAQWDEIVAALAGQLRHAAALLDGRMPDDIDDTLRRLRAVAVPEGRRPGDHVLVPRPRQPVQARRRRPLRARPGLRRRPVPAADPAGSRPARAARRAPGGEDGRRFERRIRRSRTTRLATGSAWPTSTRPGCTTRPATCPPSRSSPRLPPTPVRRSVGSGRPRWAET